ncbi:Hypothetical protein PROPJV5_0993 [Propionibacterium ruminifibrarum]|uniref:Uncharacterized protein n=1 Tax=Propionibacterium ruminifibrarum TaxID=1962131 RepID=A0A375I1Q5_9ACTN|nr:hypothetical protein [Propionibacterium ruminifibrarum]SPF68036.1 Hypothetical protein PROPJV5_0993 [Propionibacterium ruminifibrarum]
MSTAAKPVGLHDDLWSSHTAMPADLAVLDLPDGELFSGDHGEVLGYRIADKTEPLCGLWLRCAKQFPSTGLWPILSRTSYKWESVSFGERHWTQHYWRAPYRTARSAFDTWCLPDRLGDDESWTADDEREALRDAFGWEPHWEEAEPSPQPEHALRLLTRPYQMAVMLLLVACHRPSRVQSILDFGVPNDSATPGMLAGILPSWELRFGVVPL